MRITQNTLYQLSSTHIEQLKQDINKSTHQVMTGERYQRDSDSPLTAAKRQSLEVQMERYEQYLENVSDVKMRLSEFETRTDILTESFNVIELAVADYKSINGISGNTREYNAQEIDAAIEQIIATMNETGAYGNNYFSGGDSKALEPVRDADGNLLRVDYVGSTTHLSAPVGPGISVKTETTANSILSGALLDLNPGGGQIPNITDPSQTNRDDSVTPIPDNESVVTVTTLNKLIAFSNELKSPTFDQAKADDLAVEATAAASDMSKALQAELVELGSNMEYMNTVEIAYEDTLNKLELDHVEVAGIDQIEAISEFQQNQTLYSTFLKVTAQLHQGSLFDTLF